MNNEKSNQVKILQNTLVELNLNAFIVPTDDPHLSEYTAPFYYRREFISGFTGSAGTAIITQDKALLFVDGRYHNQADLEVDKKYWTVMKQGLKDVPTITEYLSKHLPFKAIVGIDPFITSEANFAKLSKTLNESDKSLKECLENPIDRIWGEQRPLAPSGTLRIHSLAVAGKSVNEKLAEVRRVLIEKNTTALVLASLDEIAWLFNIRGKDVPCNPVAISYAVITLGIMPVYASLLTDLFSYL